MRNNIGFPNKNSNMGGVDTMFNTWDLNIAQPHSDFESVMRRRRPRAAQADGSLPAIAYMKLRRAAR